MFLSSHEKQLDAKRRLLVPQDFRAAALQALDGPNDPVPPFEGLYCFAAIDAQCIECGGAAFFATYRDEINQYSKLSATRKALEHRFYAAMQRLNFDTAGRITLPEKLCQKFGLTSDVLLTGLGDSFQIWEPSAYEAYAVEQDRLVTAAFSGRGERA